MSHLLPETKNMTQGGLSGKDIYGIIQLQS